MLDSNLVTVALPSIRADLGLNYTELQWVVGAYALTFGASLLPAARSVDLYGGRSLLRGGLLLFSLAVVGCVLAPSAPVLVAMRALQGVGAAMALPSSLALISSNFPDPAARRHVLGLYGAAVSSAFVVGVVAGGALTLAVGWRGAMLVEAPLAACAALVAGRLPAARGTRAGPGFNVGTAVGLGGAAAVALYGLARMSAARGLDETGLGCLALAALLVYGALSRDLRSATPLVPRTARSSHDSRSACLTAFLTVATGVGAMFVLTLYLQEVRGLSPPTAGAALALLGLAGIGAGSLLPAIAARTGLTVALRASLLIQALGVSLLVPIGAHGGLGWLVGGCALLGAGHFAATVAFTALATRGVPPRDHGIALGMLGCCQQLGGAFGLAVIAGLAGAGGSPERGLRWALVAACGMSLSAAALTRADPS